MSKFARRAWLEEEIIIFHQDNAPADKIFLAIEKLQDLRYYLLGHPDLAPSDFHLFPSMKKFVFGKCFASNEEVERAVDVF